MNGNARLTGDHLQRDPDHTIDRALSALRDAQPRPGLAGRILASLEHRASEPGGLPFHNVKGWGIARGNAREKAGRSTNFSLWAATSAAILAITSLIILHHHAAPMTNGGSAFTQHTPNAVILSEAQSAKSKDLDTARHATNPKPFSTTNPAQTTKTMSSRPEPLSEPKASRTGRSGETPVFENCAENHPGCPTHEDEGATVPTDAQALADLHAPSHPAPPLPLTPQEKLFLRVLRYSDATQLAELDPLVRAAQDDAEATEFKAFFPNPPLPKDPGENE